MKECKAFDVVINGGSMVGLALACGLQGTGLRVAVIERQRPLSLQIEEQSKRKVSVINTASRRLLQHVQVWQEIAAEYANPYRSLEVWEGDSFGRISFDVTGMGYSELGHIITNCIIQQALWRRAEQLAEVILIAPTTLRQVVWGENAAFITLDNDHMLTARLVVAADGARSWLRSHVDIPLTFWDCQNHALVATVCTAQPHSNIARQTFKGDSVLAFFPLSNPHLSSIVWSLPPSVAKEYLKTSTSAFNASVAIHSNLTLGLCELQGHRNTFPLTSRYALNFAAHRLVLLGDAAHTVHSLAGHDVNLGFMDVAELLGEVRRLQKAGKDIGHYPYLRRYERRRKLSAALMLLRMRGLDELVATHQPFQRWIRSTGFRLIDTLPSAKQHLLKQMMGLNDAPAWLSAEECD
ncbi:FAD-dependent monooxygenase [secondary endosymbiont of Ctenarytaina eucalypti]|uniref:Ubiquinone biosynthesis hydroxylase, UbiH/UbiF/VisC/COQ6 family n=1 Tax=secondary endosymbiont of Ctenarytaina eucalypti TaxID=1199245 RepID=J3TFE8_9ENTR|nr:FAD-dependent monooxygenase [secondary endosymbiont of Ctenarytaina eucalypti]AFP84922.1 Ubiquinone biosynthesis hydroxylase, UbiH/UbiF/VisC/COQ6 family [secondary endosymbiont of Ctenarytaina eucalypti]